MTDLATQLEEIREAEKNAPNERMNMTMMSKRRKGNCPGCGMNAHAPRHTGIHQCPCCGDPQGRHDANGCWVVGCNCRWPG